MSVFGKALVDNAIFGILLGVLLALPVLVLSTCNIINGVLATLIIAAITACVIGVIPLMGWSMGVSVKWLSPLLCPSPFATVLEASMPTCVLAFMQDVSE